MNKVLIVQNISIEGPGLIKEVLDENKISYDLIDLTKGQSFPAPQGYHAVFVLGGPDSANDHSAKIHQEFEWLQEVLALNIPFFGICLGLQIMVKAAGGKVVKNHVKEIGFQDPSGNAYEVILTKAGIDDPLFVGLPTSFDVFHLHGETVELTDNMILLATGKHCTNQIVKIAPKTYGIQAHCEVTPDLLQVLASHDIDLRMHDTEKILNHFKEIQPAYTKIGKQLFINFLKLANVIS